MRSCRPICSFGTLSARAASCFSRATGAAAQTAPTSRELMGFASSGPCRRTWSGAGADGRAASWRRDLLQQGCRHLADGARCAVHGGWERPDPLLPFAQQVIAYGRPGTFFWASAPAERQEHPWRRNGPRAGPSRPLPTGHDGDPQGVERLTVIVPGRTQRPCRTSPPVPPPLCDAEEAFLGWEVARDEQPAQSGDAGHLS